MRFTSTRFTFNKSRLIGALSFGLASLAMLDAHAGVMTFSDRANWEAAASHWNDTATPAGIDEFASTNSLTLNNGTVLTLGTAVTAFKIGSSWYSWSGAYQDMVFYTENNASVTVSVTPGAGLGLEMEPDNFGDYAMSLTLGDGATVSQTVSGEGGAAFFGWVGTGVSSFTMSTGDQDFAFGHFVEAKPEQVPEPMTTALMGIGALGALLGRRKSAKSRAI